MRWTRRPTARSKSARGGRRLLRASPRTRSRVEPVRIARRPSHSSASTRPKSERAWRADGLPGRLDAPAAARVQGAGAGPARASVAAGPRPRSAGAANLASGARPVAPSRALGVLRPLRRLLARPRPPVLPGSAPRAGRHRAPARTAPAAAPSALLGARGQRERLVEEAVEGRPVRLVLDERRGQRLAHRLALDPHRGDGHQRGERLGDRHVDPAPRAQLLYEIEDARPHPRMLAAYAKRSDRSRSIHGMKEKNVYTVASMTSDSYTNGSWPSRRRMTRNPHALALKRRSVAPVPMNGIHESRIGLPSDHWWCRPS